MKFGIRRQLIDIITYVKFLVNQFRGYGVLTSQNSHFPWMRRPYNSVRTTVRQWDTMFNVLFFTCLPLQMQHHIYIDKLFNYYLILE